MRESVWAAVAAVVLFSAAGNAVAEQAAQSGGSTNDAASGFYAGVALGRTEQDVDLSGRSILVITNPIGIFGPIGQLVPPHSIHVDSGQMSWDATLGYRVNRYFAAEFTYLQFGETDYS